MRRWSEVEHGGLNDTNQVKTRAKGRGVSTQIGNHSQCYAATTLPG